MLYQTKKDQQQNIIPITVWVQFENEQIGKNHRNKNSYLYSNIKIHHIWTPIKKNQTIILSQRYLDSANTISTPTSSCQNNTCITEFNK